MISSNDLIGFLLVALFLIFILFSALIVQLNSSSSLSSKEEEQLFSVSPNRARNAAIITPNVAGNGKIFATGSLGNAYSDTPYNNLQRKFLIVILPTVKESNTSSIKSLYTLLKNNSTQICKDLNTNANECIRSWYSQAPVSTFDILTDSNISVYTSSISYGSRNLPIFKEGVIPIFIGLMNNNSYYYGFHDYFSEEIMSFPFSNSENTIITTNYLIRKFTPFSFIDLNAIVKYPRSNFVTNFYDSGSALNSLTVTISHEVCEIIVNPYVSNFTSDGKFYLSNGTETNVPPGWSGNSKPNYTYMYFWFVESSDAVQSTTLTNGKILPLFYVEGRTAVSDFLYPCFFDTRVSAINGQYDRCNIITGKYYSYIKNSITSLSRIAIAPTNGDPSNYFNKIESVKYFEVITE